MDDGQVADIPIANVLRIMKNALPENAKIAKEAKECVQECVSEFISFITSEASEKCQQEKRKTVNGEDILFAMASLGFENYAEALKIYLTKYRESSKTERFDPPDLYGRGIKRAGSADLPQPPATLKTGYHHSSFDSQAGTNGENDDEVAAAGDNGEADVDVEGEGDGEADAADLGEETDVLNAPAY